MHTAEMNDRKGFGSCGIFTASAGILALHWLFLALFLGVSLDSGSASAVEFVTREAFHVENNPYKAYPDGVLFKKLRESDATERRKIRNVIILKQVFEPEFKERAEAAGAGLETYYGVVRELDGENLRLWLPGTDGFKDFFVGIDRIPVENEHDFDISQASIGKYAVIAHVLDNRIYKLTVSFDLVPPRTLDIRQRGAGNVVQWEPPKGARKPTAYRVMVNGKTYKTVEGTTVEVPRSEGQADTYVVRAVYEHGSTLIESTASSTLYDEVSAKAIQERQSAEKAYGQILAHLRASEWLKAKNRLYESRSLMDEHLPGERKSHMQTLAGFFRNLEEGDRLMERQPLTPEHLRSAMTYYRQAENKAGTLAEKEDLLVVVRGKITENETRMAELEQRDRRQSAETAYDRVVSELNAAGWQDARKLLYENRSFMEEHLAPGHRAAMATLLSFFGEIDQGDRLAAAEPRTVENLETALNHYRRAQKRAADLPAGIDALFIVQGRISEAAGKKATLETDLQAQRADQIYNRITGLLTPSDWEKGEALLYESREQLLTHLPADHRSVIAELLQFFREIEEGNRLMDLQPMTLERLDEALTAYRRAEEKSAIREAAVNTAFIARQKIGAAENRKAMFAAGQQKELATETYQRITGLLTPTDWEQARTKLYRNRDLLTAHLAEAPRGVVTGLLGFFLDIDAGDRLAGIEPRTPENLDKAVNAYRRAEGRAKSMAPGLDTTFIARQKIAEADGLKASLEAVIKKEQAESIYARILVALNPGEWPAAKEQLYGNREQLIEQLDDPRKETVRGLIAFFKDIDEGDRNAGQQPETVRSLAQAARFYERAGQKAESLTKASDIKFIAQQKLSDNTRRKTTLEKQQKRQVAGEAYGRILESMTPAGWEKARQLIVENKMLLIEQLEREQKETILGLIGFFTDVDEGDRLMYMEDESTKSLETALTFYRRAGQRAEAFAERANARFIVEMKVKEARSLLAEMGERQQEEAAGRVYDRVIAALNPADWQAGKVDLFENRKLLEAHLPPERKSHIDRLIGFFDTIETGDRLIRESPVTGETLDRAQEAYERSAEAAAALSGIADLGFVGEGKIGEVRDRRARLARSEEQQNARQVYDRIVGTLTPTQWETARTLLGENEALLVAQLDPERQARIRDLNAFFELIAEGDRLIALEPETRDDLDMAQASYRLAEQKAKALADTADLLPVVEAKLGTVAERQTALETRRKQALAAKTFGEITAALNPSDWQTASKQALDKMKLLTDYLEPDPQETAGLLIDFFRDIAEGDRIGFQRPESDETLDGALAMYRQAEEKAISLSSRLDVMFIAEERINGISARKQTLYEQQQALMAAQQAAAPPPQPVYQQSAPVRRSTPAAEPFDDTVDPQRAIELAMQNFNKRRYDYSLRYFMKAYEGPIGKMKKGGKRQVVGLLGLPPKYRAEVTFLVALDRLKKDAGGDKAIVREGLIDVLDQLENATGPWSIIMEQKKNKIRKHIERY